MKPTTIRCLFVLALCLTQIESVRAQARHPFAPAPSSADVKTAPELSPTIGSAPASTLSPRSGSTATAPGSKSIDPRAPVASRRGIDHSRMYYDRPGDGSLWARGADYKVAFDAAGVTYYPLFGARQEQHRPLALSPDLVTQSGEEVGFQRAGAAELDGDRVRIDHGSFAEVYDFQPGSVEQSFVFDALPRDGELVLRIPVASSMDVSPQGDGLEFRAEQGRVRYGRVTAVDAAGRRIDCPSAFESGAITIRVDAAFVGQAALPLVIDPIVTSFPVDTTSFDDGAPDVCYDATFDHWVVVYEETATSSDHDVYFEMLTWAGAQIWGAYVDATTANWVGVHCANLRAYHQFLAAAVVGSAGSASIRGRTIEAGALATGSQFTISGSESGWMASVAVGGDPFPSTFPGSRYLVVYERVFGVGDNDILARYVSSNSGTSSTTLLSNSSGTVDHSPSVSRSNDQFDWTIAWQRTSGAGNNLFVGRMRYDGTIVNGPTQVSTGGTDFSPCVSSPLTGTARTLLVFERNYGTDHDIQGLLLDGATVVRDVDISARENAATFQNQVTPWVDSDGQHFLVGYGERFSSSPTDFDVYVADLFVSGNDIGVKEAHVNLAFTSLHEGNVRVSSAHGSGGAGQRFLAAWDKQTTSTNADVLGALFDTLPGGVASTTCPGDLASGGCPCGNFGSNGHGCASSVNSFGALLAASGSLSTATDTTVLTASGMPPTAACLFFQGSTITPAGVFGDGLRCTAGTIVRIAPKTAVNGTATFPGPGELTLSQAGNVPVTGATFNYQVWYRNSASFCTSATFNLTNGVRIEWAR